MSKIGQNDRKLNLDEFTADFWEAHPEGMTMTNGDPMDGAWGPQPALGLRVSGSNL